MKIETKFDFGDTIYFIGQARRQTWIPCPLCDENGEIVVINGNTRRCPDCYGRRGKTEYGLHEWRISKGPVTIGQIRVDVRQEYRDGDVSDFDNFGHQSGYHEEGYMCRETGIGTGSVYESDRCFATRAEAEAECARRNAEEVTE